MQDFCAWLESSADHKALGKGLRALIKGSGLHGKHTATLLKNAVEAITNVTDKWLTEYEPSQQEHATLTAANLTDPYAKRVKRDLERLTGEYLLSDLATRGFLPSYGFPAGIASFNLYSIDDYKHSKREDKQRDDNLSISRAKPTRDLSIAIREYAPSNDIVLNGLVYRSAGLTLNWHTPSGQMRETQKLMKIGRCNKCGAMKHSFGSQFPKICQCGAAFSPIECREFIEPAGFAVDFHSTPTTDVSMQHYVPVQEPWVTANSELCHETFGSYRVDTQGSIFYHSSGEEGFGYALCWCCGRAESMMQDDKLPDVFSKPHQKLRGSFGAGSKLEKFCDGNEKNFSIKRNLHLGYVDNTDVLELYLKHPNDEYLNHNNETDAQIAWTLAMVLRQALADCSQAVAAIVIYDVCSGGGFSCAAPPFFADMFVKARGYLHCSCAGVCQNCLLGFDTRFCLQHLNRQAAEQFLQG